MSENYVEGLKDLSKQLNSLGTKLAVKQLKSATMLGTSPALRKIKAAAPVGKKEHKTYTGRLVAPAFLKRSIKRKSKFNKKTGMAETVIGVKKEAYYGVQFLDEGTKYITARHWFAKVFERMRPVMVSEFKKRLKQKINEAVRK
jgi:HK97 gp10 family phage protein